MELFNLTIEVFINAGFCALGLGLGRYNVRKGTERQDEFPLKLGDVPYCIGIGFIVEIAFRFLHAILVS